MIHVKQLSILFFVIVMAACKKEKIDVPSNPPVTDNTINILQSGDWKITAFTITSAAGGTTDVLLNMPPCEKDNLFQFKTNNVFYFDQGATKCDPSGAQRETGTWSYDASIKELKCHSASMDFVIDITSINGTTINGIRNVTMNGVNYVYTGMLTKQ